MSSITTWMRLEPRARDAGMAEGLSARLRDPLWILARQWQTGEFRGEDAASPIVADIRLSHARITRYRPGPPGGAAIGYDSAALPLEALVERESALSRSEPEDGDAAGVLLALRAGMHFLRLLAAAGVDAAAYRARYLDAFALAPPPESLRSELDTASARYLSVVSGRSLDARRLYPTLRTALGEELSGSLPAELLVSEGDRVSVTAAAATWLAWYDSYFSEPAAEAAATWASDRLEYQFAIAAHTGAEEVVLEAEGYPGGHLDWYSFERRAGTTLGAVSAPASTVRRTLVPSPVGFHGMPVNRWWEFEDAQVDFGAVDASAVDLARLILLEFALIYGNDWFVIPVDLPVGSLAWVDSLIVTDTFGERISVSPVAAGDGAWRMFQATSAAQGTGVADPLFLPPVLAQALESQPIEEVVLVRDEMANLAWAIERKAEGPGGLTIDRYEAFQQGRQRLRDAGTAAAMSSIGDVAYRFAGTTPDYWYPLVPVRTTPSSRANRLRRGAMLQPDGTAQAVPLGRMLEPSRVLSLREEEVPRAGVHLTRSAQLARWIGGTTLLWMGRRKRTGRGEGSSGLRYDVVK